MVRSILLIASVLFVTSGVFEMQAQGGDCGSLPWEANLTYQVNQLDAGWRMSSTIVSDALLPVTIGTPALMYVYGILNVKAFADSDSPQSTWRYSSESGLQLGVAMGVTYGVTYILKTLIGRERPYQAYPECITGHDSFSDGSMPSGHAAGTAAFATTLILRYPQWYVIGPTVAYALYTGFARMNLGMHYLSDLIAGYALGVGIALGVNALNEALFDLADPILPAHPTEGSAIVYPSMSQSIPLVSYSFSF